MIISSPITADDFDKYYELRWKILRAPWNQPKGSEKDEHEDKAVHIIAKDENDNIIGVGRGHLISEDVAQIRYMAVDDSHQGKGVGLKILIELEKRISEKGAKKIILNSRDSAIKFYEKHDYKVVEKSHILFDQIPHYQMEKYI